jgi:Zn2+/Cd2+-exporting ATPase
VTEKTEAIECADAHCGACAPVDAGQASAPNRVGARAGATVFRIQTMDCAVEESEIRRALEPVAGINGLNFQLGARTLAITAPENVIAQALTAIQRVGFDPQPLSAASGSASGQGHDQDHGDDHEHGSASEGLRPLLIALALALAAEGVAFFAGKGAATTVVEMALALGAIWFAGFDTYKKGLIALRFGRLNINALMTVAVTGAFVIGQWPEAAMVMALYAIAELIEARSVDRARNAIKGLIALSPERADVRQADGRWAMVKAVDVPLQAVVRIRPGERVPLDGVVTEGSSAIDQAPVTGESIPVDKTVGDAVFAGTINQTGELEFRVTAAADNTTLARIIHAVEQAQGTRAPTQRFVDRFAAIYTPGVFVLALAVAIGMPWLMGWTWMEALYKALVLLVIACPCALVISTPVTVVSALASAARRGILIKGGTYLEDARNLKAIALDKTGTITEGKPKLVEFVVIDDAAEKSQVALIAASLAARSDHPVSHAIALGLNLNGDGVTEFKALAGRGVQGLVNGKVHVLGNHRLIEERGRCSPALEAQLKTHEEAGRTVTLLATDTGVLALFAVADTIKASSQQAVAELKALGIVPVMLTGDNIATAKTIAAHAGIDEAQGNLLPEDKLAAIKGLQALHDSHDR